MGIETDNYSTKPRKKYFEQQATEISALGRYELQKRIMNFKGRFKLDFTENYLKKLSVDRLRHILLAAQINTKSSRPSGSRGLESKSEQ